MHDVKGPWRRWEAEEEERRREWSWGTRLREVQEGESGGRRTRCTHKSKRRALVTPTKHLHFWIPLGGSQSERDKVGTSEERSELIRNGVHEGDKGGMRQGGKSLENKTILLGNWGIWGNYTSFCQQTVHDAILLGHFCMTTAWLSNHPSIHLSGFIPNQCHRCLLKPVLMQIGKDQEYTRKHTPFTFTPTNTHRAK